MSLSAAEELEQLKRNYAEFQESSHELEAELERELKDIRTQLDKSQSELQRRQALYDALAQDRTDMQARTGAQLLALQSSNEQLKTENASLKEQVTKLENKVSHLSRTKRASVYEVQELRQKLDTAVETKVLLSQDVDQLRAEYEEAMQRLRDELRDVREELTAVHRTHIKREQELQEAEERLAADLATVQEAQSHDSSSVHAAANTQNGKVNGEIRQDRLSSQSVDAPQPCCKCLWWWCYPAPPPAPAHAESHTDIPLLEMKRGHTKNEPSVSEQSL